MADGADPLENYYLPGDETEVEAFVIDYNHCGYREASITLPRLKSPSGDTGQDHG
jgi:hypothetical protein